VPNQRPSQPNLPTLGHPAKSWFFSGLDPRIGQGNGERGPAAIQLHGDSVGQLCRLSNRDPRLPKVIDFRLFMVQSYRFCPKVLLMHFANTNKRKKGHRAGGQD